MPSGTHRRRTVTSQRSRKATGRRRAMSPRRTPGARRVRPAGATAATGGRGTTLLAARATVRLLILPELGRALAGGLHQEVVRVVLRDLGGDGLLNDSDFGKELRHPVDRLQRERVV